LRVTSAVGSEFAVAGPLDACVSVGGEEVRGCLADDRLARASFVTGIASETLDGMLLARNAGPHV